MSYDSPTFTSRQEARANVAGAASGTLHKFVFFQKARIKKVHGVVTTAGTHTAAVMDIYNGTSSIGSLAFGTSAAGAAVHSAALDATVDANGYIDLKGATNSATLVAGISVEFEVLPDAVRS